MFTVLKSLAAAAVVLALAGNATGCQPPATPPPAQPPAPTQAPTPVSVSFIAEVVKLSEAGVTRLIRTVTVKIDGLQADGLPALIEDPVTKKKVPGPKVVIRKTPYRYDATFAPPVIGMKFTVTYLGQAGEEVVCKTLKNGQQIFINSAEVQAGPGGRGAAETFCLYAGN